VGKITKRVRKIRTKIQRTDRENRAVEIRWIYKRNLDRRRNPKQALHTKVHQKRFTNLLLKCINFKYI